MPESKRAGYLLQELQKEKRQIAIVRDEYGMVTGIVTVEDLIEEIVGEIQDEHETVEPDVVEVDSKTLLVRGTMPLEEFAERMGISMPDEDTDTVGGYVLGLLGHQPRKGESVVRRRLRFTVEETDGKRIDRVRVVQEPGR